ncbi:mitochondrial carrier domain-containing protein [Pelagophyceae sp. CCMP2097]|nr:mitochondrial carrier domain-containing protein [Pelagophyceae sp. CCMP2097]
MRTLVAVLRLALCVGVHSPARAALVALRTKKQRPKVSYFYGCAAAGAVSTSVTHTVFLPLDVIKTRMQSDKALAAMGARRSMQHVLATQGAKGLLAGAGANFAGYFAQGALKFGLYERFKRDVALIVASLTDEETSRRWRIPIWMLSSACAEVVACVALCPMEATKIRMVTDSAYARSTAAALRRILREEGARSLYRGIFPIMVRQVPYTVTKLVGYEMLAKAFGAGLAPGVIAGAAAAFVSQPGDVLLSKMCGGSKIARVGQQCSLSLAAALSSCTLPELFVGLQPRAAMCAAICAGQFFLYEALRPKPAKVAAVA